MIRRRKSPDTEPVSDLPEVSDSLPIPPQNRLRSVEMGVSISSLNAHRVRILHKRLFEQQALADPGEVLEPISYNVEGDGGFLNTVIENALTDYFDNQPGASEITRAALLMSNEKPPEELFE